MKSATKTITFILFVIIARSVYSQNYSSAGIVYYTPIPDRVYFALEMKTVYLEFLPHKRVDSNKYDMVENDLLTFNENVPVYKVNEDYSNGDIVKIKVIKEDRIHDKPAIFTFVKIIGELNVDIIDKKVVEMSENLFGLGKVQPWPEDMYVNKYKPNEKAIECDFYVLSSLHNIKPEIANWYNDVNTGVNIGNANNLIIFETSSKVFGSQEYLVKEIDNYTNRHFKVSIHQKLKAGKKGKKIGGATENHITSEYQDQLDEKEVDIYPFNHKDISLRGPFVVSWMQMNELVDELVKHNSEYFEQNIPLGIEKAFAKIK